MKIIAGCALGLMAVSALAHDMYILPGSFRPAKGELVKAGFHVGDSFPDSEVSGRIERLVNPRLLWQGGEVAFGNLRVEGKRDVADVRVGGSGNLIAAVQTKPTLIELEPKKFVEYLREEGLAEVIAWREQHGESGKPGKERYSKFAKSLLLSGAPNGFATNVVGLTVEIVPEADPYEMKVGDQLPVRVLFRGKPAGGLQLEAAWASASGNKTVVVGRTDTEGRIRVPLQTAGRWRLHTIKMERCSEPAVADWESFWASLTFEIQ